MSDGSAETQTPRRKGIPGEPVVHPLWNAYEVLTEAEIAAARVAAHVPAPVVVVEYDETWPARFAELEAVLRGALGAAVLEVHHVGSTSVPGLAAKPVIDADLIVANSADEAAYLPQLAAAGFDLRVREPEWEEHRCLKHVGDRTCPETNLHVFSPGAREPQRHRMFREWLATHSDDREAYAAIKREVAAQGFTDVMLYNNAKSGLIYDIYEKIFVADPAQPHTPQPRP